MDTTTKAKRARRADAGLIRTTERDLAHTGSGAAAHRPDGLVVIDARPVAVEVELTQKERRRAARIMGELTATYASVTYFAAPAPSRLLSVLADEIGGGRVQVLPLPEEVSP